MNGSHDLVALTCKIHTAGSHDPYHPDLYECRTALLTYPGLAVRGVAPMAAADWLD